MDEAGSVTYALSVTAAGTYKIVAKVYAASDAYDSYYFSIDGAQLDIWDYTLANNNAWIEDDLAKRGTGSTDAPQYNPYVFSLSAGNHILMLKGRELEAKVDYFYLVPVTTCSAADVDCNGCISQTELLQYIQQWKSGQATLSNLMEAIRLWKAGC
jgi:hypothetical protein